MIVAQHVKCWVRLGEKRNSSRQGTAEISPQFMQHKSGKGTASAVPVN